MSEARDWIKTPKTGAETPCDPHSTRGKEAGVLGEGVPVAEAEPSGPTPSKLDAWESKAGALKAKDSGGNGSFGSAALATR